MSTLTLDTSDIPGWDLALVIRGVEVRTKSPMEAADRSVVNLGAGEPGAVVRLWRWAFGAPRRRVADDHETRELRRTVAAFTPGAHHRLLETLSGGELLAVLGNYVGAQSAWYARIERSAREEAERVWGLVKDRAGAQAGPGAPTPTAVGPGVGSGVGLGRAAVPPMKLVPGQPLPAMAAGLVDDFRGGRGEGNA